MLAFVTVRNWLRTAFSRTHLSATTSKTNTTRQPCIDTAEAVSPPTLSESQKQSVRQSWQLVHNEIEHFGSVAILRLIEHKLDFKMAFAEFRDMPIEEIRQSPLVKMHAMSVLHVVEQLVSRLDQPASWNLIIDELCRRHVHYNAIPSLAPDVAAFCWTAMKPILEQREIADKQTEEAWCAIFTWLGRAFESATNKHFKAHALSHNGKATK